MLTGILYGVATGALWGFIFLVSKILTGYTAADIALGRFVVCGLVSAAVLAPRFRQLRPALNGRVILQALILSCLSYSLYFLALAQAVKSAGLVPATLVIGLLPVTIPLAAHDKIAKPFLFYISLVLILSGLLALNAPALSGLATISDEWIKGMAIACVAVAMWSAFAILNARFLKHHPEINSSDWSSLLGIGAFITIIPVWFLLTPEHGIPQRLFATRYLLWMLMAGFGGSWLAACFWNAASKRLPASLAGQLIVSETIFSLLYGYIYDHRLPTLIEAAAALLLIGGVLTGIRAFRKVEKISA